MKKKTVIQQHGLVFLCTTVCDWTMYESFCFEAPTDSTFLQYISYLTVLMSDVEFKLVECRIIEVKCSALMQQISNMVFILYLSFFILIESSCMQFVELLKNIPYYHKVWPFFVVREGFFIVVFYFVYFLLVRFPPCLFQCHQHDDVFTSHGNCNTI